MSTTSVHLLLTIDIGNTHSTFGIWNKNEILNTIRVSSSTERTSHEWYGLLKPWVSEVISKKRLTALTINAIYSSVVSTINTTLENALLLINIKNIYKVSSSMKLPFKFNYEGVSSLGQDRIANVTAAVKCYSKNSIVIDFGTAITFCLIINGIYQGGVIAPGYNSIVNSFHSSTAQLPLVHMKRNTIFLGDDTVSSLQTGLYYSMKGIFKEILYELKSIDIIKSLPDEEKPITIVTGGISVELDFLDKYVDVIDANLTLQGLKILYEHSKK